MGVLSTNPRTWAATAKLLAAQLNAEIRDPFTTLQSPWTAYTPQLTSEGTSPTLGSGGSIAGRYHQIGKTVFLQGQLALGGSGLALGTQRWLISLPSGLSFFNTSYFGQAQINPAGAANFSVKGTVLPNSQLSVFYIFAPATTTASTDSGIGGTGANTTPGGTTLAANGLIRWNFVGELA